MPNKHVHCMCRSEWMCLLCQPCIQRLLRLPSSILCTHVTSPACTECHWCHPPPDCGCLSPYHVYSYLRFYTAMPISKLAAFMEMVRSQLHSYDLGIHSMSACNLYCMCTYVCITGTVCLVCICAFCLCQLCVVYVRRCDFENSSNVTPVHCTIYSAHSYMFYECTCLGFRNFTSQEMEGHTCLLDVSI